MLRNVIAPDLRELLDTGTPGDIDFYCQYARLRGGPVLVLLCGVGRVAIPIARQGVPVIAIDSDAAVIDHAKRKATEVGTGRIIVASADPTDFVSNSKHSLAIIPAGALQRLLTLEEQRLALAAIRGALALGGRLMFDIPVLDPEAQAPLQPVVRHMGPSGEGVVVISRHRRFDAARQLIQETVACEWLNDQGHLKTKQYAETTQRYSTPGEIALLMEVCGFTPTFFGGFDHQPFVPGANRLVVEAERSN